jgi:membrane protease YdiL (CAAX protease family)
MTKTLGGFRAALLIGWIVLGAAGVLYARGRGIPAWAAVPVLAAFLFEYLFYLVPGFEQLRERLAGPRLPWLLAASAVAPYLVYSIGTGQFQWAALAKLTALALIVSFWYVVLPAGAFADIGLLCLLAAVLLRKYFDPIYSPPVPRLDVDILGHLALIHVSAMALLVQRRVAGTGFGFLPGREEWAIGVRHFLYFLPVGVPMALAIGAFRLGPVAPVWKIAGTFFGILWVVALSEEFFFRGLLQQQLTKWTGSAHAGLAIASVLFGSVHLGFRAFPNWRFALVAAVAGWFYGRAFQQARSIRAPMVTHALVVTTWRALFA